MGVETTVPIPVLRRLSHYLHHVRTQLDLDQEWISSLALADALDVTSSTVRQDLSCLNVSGIAKRGYRVNDLVGSILNLLGRDETTNMVIVGAGNLGRALALHDEFPRQGFAVRALFDADPKLVGENVGNLNIRGLDSLPTVVRDERVEIGVIAVPSKPAQDVADLLVSVGVKGILNMSVAHVRTPPEVPVVAARLYSNLSLLSYALKARKKVHKPKGG